MAKPKSVDEYINSAPEELQQRLKDIKQAIMSSAPEAIEKISYSMPYYDYKGRLAYFSYFKNHIGLYLTPPLIEDFKNELKEYNTSKATIQFPHDKKLPITLIKKLVKARVSLNEQLEDQKQ